MIRQLLIGTHIFILFLPFLMVDSICKAQALIDSKYRIISQLKPKGRPKSFTKSCKPIFKLINSTRKKREDLGNGLRSTFEVDELLFTVRSLNPKAVLYKGYLDENQLNAINQIDDYKFDLLHMELVPVFVNKKKKVANLSSKQIISVLKGITKTWAQLGYSDEKKIQIYLHGAKLQRSTFEKWASTLGINRKDIAATNPIYANNYDSLEDLATSDENSFTIGISKFEKTGLIAVKVGGLSIIEDQNDYPLKLPIFLMHSYKSDHNYLAGYLSSLYLE